MRRILLMVITFGVLGMAAPVTADARDVTHIRGQAGHTTFQSQDGCISNYVEVYFTEIETRSLPQRPRAASNVATIFIQQWDDCRQTMLIWAAGYDIPLLEGAVQVANNLSSATLNASLELVDYTSYTPVTADVHLTWMATDQSAKPSFYHTTSHIPGYTYNYHATGKTRTAQVSGSVSVGSVDYTPIPTSDGEFGTEIGGEVTIYKMP
jgi:hypothetical protein